MDPFTILLLIVGLTSLVFSETGEIDEDPATLSSIMDRLVRIENFTHHVTFRLEKIEALLGTSQDEFYPGKPRPYWNGLKEWNYDAKNKTCWKALAGLYTWEQAVTACHMEFKEGIDTAIPTLITVATEEDQRHLVALLGNIELFDSVQGFWLLRRRHDVIHYNYQPVGFTPIHSSPTGIGCIAVRNDDLGNRGVWVNVDCDGQRVAICVKNASPQFQTIQQTLSSTGHEIQVIKEDIRRFMTQSAPEGLVAQNTETPTRGQEYETGAQLNHRYRQIVSDTEDGYVSALGCPESVFGFPWVKFGNTSSIRCYLVGLRGPCKEGMKMGFRRDISLPGYCKCDSCNDAPSDVDEAFCHYEGVKTYAYYEQTDNCYELFKQGPCPEGKVLSLYHTLGKPICAKDKCKLTPSPGSTSTTVFDPFTSTCLTVGPNCRLHGSIEPGAYKLEPRSTVPVCGRVEHPWHSLLVPSLLRGDCPDGHVYSRRLARCVKPLRKAATVG